MGLWLGCLAAL